MHARKWIIRGLVAALPLGLLSLALADDAPKVGDTGIAGTVIDANTIPSDKRNVSFPDIGIVKEVLVKPGDVVTKGQELASEDSDMDELELASMQEDADAAVARITAAVADRDSKKLKYENLAKLETTARTGTELDEAKLDYEEAEAEITYATKEHDKMLADVTKQARKVEKMKLLSPMDGIVQKISVQPGEVVDPNKPDGMMTLVCTKPLWADVEVPSVLASQLKVGDTLQVAYKDKPDNWMDCKIIYFNPVADASSEQEVARIQLDNDEQAVAGLWIMVKLPAAAK